MILEKQEVFTFILKHFYFLLHASFFCRNENNWENPLFNSVHFSEIATFVNWKPVDQKFLQVYFRSYWKIRKLHLLPWPKLLISSVFCFFAISIQLPIKKVVRPTWIAFSFVDFSMTFLNRKLLINYPLCYPRTTLKLPQSFKHAKQCHLRCWLRYFTHASPILYQLKFLRSHAKACRMEIEIIIEFWNKSFRTFPLVLADINKSDWIIALLCFTSQAKEIES